MDVRKYLFKIIVLAALLMSSSKGAPKALAGEQKLSLVDTLGRKVAIAIPAERVLSLQPEITRIIVALGAGDRLVGLDYFLRRDDHLFRIVYPQQARLPVVSKPDDSINKEAIVGLRPDLIFASPSELLVPDSIERTLGIPVVALSSQGSFARLLEEIELVGQAMSKTERARELVGYFRDYVETISRTVNAEPEGARPRVYLTFWSSLLRTPVFYEPVRVAGGVNVAEGLLPSHSGSPGTVVTIEKIISWDPDIILVHGNYLPSERRVTVEQILSDKRLSSVRAVQNGRVFYTFGYWYWWDPAEVLLETLFLAKTFHPDKFAGRNLEQDSCQYKHHAYHEDRDLLTL